MLNLKIIIGSTRPGRAADLVVPWISRAAREHRAGGALVNASATQPAAPVAVGPSRLVRVTFGPLTKILNPAIVKLAGRRHVRFAGRISHTGRRSGRHYVTPVSARLTGDTFVIPLTFGSQSDWSRNVRSAGGCEIQLNGTDYRAVRPRLADGDQIKDVIRAAFSPIERIMLRMLGIRQFLLLQRAGTGA
jgi:deazaflavin-dependent oxidoreductase (nitroreductase family)